jgi:hypothetical protein
MSGIPTAVSLASFAVAVYLHRTLPPYTAHLAIVAAAAHVLLLAAFVVHDGPLSLQGFLTTAGFSTLHSRSDARLNDDPSDVTTSPPEPSLACLQTLFAESSRHRSTRRVAPPGSAIDCVRLTRPQRAGSLVERTVLEPVSPTLPARRNALPGGVDCATRSVGAAARRPNHPSSIHNCLT